ncbi:TSUP family transporter [Priestia aryabhattai]|uniref:TSUP family transporter n=1 Tax=Priestia aryabhattai TaxID=412384 RepID=UPI0039825660
MGLTFIIVVFAIGFIGSFLSRMLGVGGSIIKYLMLLYIPPLFGLVAFTAHEVSGISTVQILFASIAGVWAYRKGGYLNKQLIIYMGGAILIGSLIGSYGSSYLSEQAVNVVYGILAVIAAVIMFVPKKHVDDIPLGQLALRKNELDKDKNYIITCQSGNSSKAACGLLEALGYKVEDMVGGMNNWGGKTE